MSLETLFNASWYGKSHWTKCFYPLMPLVRRFVKKKRQDFIDSEDLLFQSPVPVIVVGNITVGGTGKSPMVVALCEFLQSKGYSPGIVSRGYGSKNQEALRVDSSSSPHQVGDEPLMLTRRTQCPVVIGRQRVQALEKLLKECDVDVVISDDGLQHYALNRDIEIVMVDYERGFGNGELLPVGPLREPIERLKEVNFITSVIQSNQSSVVPEYMPQNLAERFSCLQLDAVDLVNLKTGEVAGLSILQRQISWHLMAAIGNPNRFLNTLLLLGLREGFTTNWLPDHYKLMVKDIPMHGAVVMTEKDAVKCLALDFSNPDVWYLRIKLQLNDDFKFNLINALSNFTKVSSK
ncbi:tetraacyldisaccharide 4'-kinase [Marinomonas sp. 2405UD68-3]|uniref:tetraacyldisaccharide 4'-kinase n=1 Tax=Marinomonas sp. 2405UD68-3 TaxID=3391835 RepID=UPI0039C910E3